MCGTPKDTLNIDQCQKCGSEIMIVNPCWVGDYTKADLVAMPWMAERIHRAQGIINVIGEAK